MYMYKHFKYSLTYCLITKALYQLYDIHIGIFWKMTEFVTRNYQQSGVIRNVRRYLEGYDLYQRIKNLTETLAEKMKFQKNCGYIE